MKKITVFIAAIAMASLAVQAGEIDVNGSFEKTYKAKSSVDYPADWSDNSASIKDKAQVIKDKDAPEGEKVLKLVGSCHILTVLKDKDCPKLTAKSVITISAKVKGTGTIEPQLVFTGADGKRIGRYDSRNKIDSPDKWSELSIKITMEDVEKRLKKGLPASFNYVVLCCRDGEIHIDDLKVDVSEDKEK